ANITILFNSSNLSRNVLVISFLRLCKQKFAYLWIEGILPCFDLTPKSGEDNIVALYFLMRSIVSFSWVTWFMYELLKRSIMFLFLTINGYYQSKSIVNKIITNCSNC